MRISYVDLKGGESERTIWPFALAFFDRVRVVVAWCESRKDYRTFRTDGIRHLAMVGGRYPRRRQAMLREWWEQEGIAAPDDAGPTRAKNRHALLTESDRTSF